MITTTLQQLKDADAEAERHFRDCPQDLRPISEIVKSFKPTEAKTDRSCTSGIYYFFGKSKIDV